MGGAGRRGASSGRCLMPPIIGLDARAGLFNIEQALIKM
jgi:hypothetical protein